MKLIDKYMLRALLLPLFYCLLAFIMITIVFDLFDNLPDFMEAKTPFSGVLKYYALFLPSVVWIIVPIALHLAVLYSLSQLTRNHEITAMRASGISLYRSLAPFILIGLLATGFVFAINDTVGPKSSYWSQQYLKAQQHKGEYNAYLAYSLPYRNEENRRVWILGTFNTQTFDVDKVEVIQQREDGSDEKKTIAVSAKWLDGKWWFFDVAIQAFDRYGSPRGAAQYFDKLEMTGLGETPTTFLNNVKEYYQLSSWEMKQYLMNHPGLSDRKKMQINVDYHNRMAMPWTCLVVTLLGIPFGTHSGREGALRGVVLALSCFFSFYILSMFGQHLGKQGTLTPILSAWLPNCLFIIIAGILIYRMR